MKKKIFKFLVAYVAISVVAVNFAFVKVETAKAGTTPSTVYVNSSWAGTSAGGSVGDNWVFDQNAFSDINDAITAVATSGTVYLLDSSNVNSDFIISAPIYINKSVNIIGEDLGTSEKVSIEFGGIQNFFDLQVSSKIFIQASAVSIENLKIIDDLTGNNLLHTIIIKDVSDIDILDNEMESATRAENYSVLDAIAFSGSVSDINISNNKISGFNGSSIISLYDEITSLSNINILENIIFDNSYAISFSIGNFDANNIDSILVEDNEIYNNGVGLYLDSSFLNKVVVINNKIYDNNAIEGQQLFDSINNVGFYVYFESILTGIIDIKNNWWGSGFPPNVYFAYYVETDQLDDDGYNIWEEEIILASGSVDEDRPNVVIEFESEPENQDYLKNINVFCRPFYKDSNLTELSKNNITVSGNGNLKSLLSLGTMTVPANEIGSTTVSQVEVDEDLEIDIPVASGVSTTTITLASSTIITKVGGGTFAHQDLSAAEMAKTALSGFESGELIGALQWGIPSVGLSFSSPVTIDMYVGTELSGQTLNLYRSTSTNRGWSQEGLLGVGGATAGTCLVSETGMCSFQTTKASYFGALTTSSSGDDDDNSSSGSSAPINLPRGIGSGSRDVASTYVGATVNAGEIGNTGVNFLTYITNQNYFSTGESSNAWRQANHRFVINSLNLDTNEAVITFYSDPKIINIKKGEIKDLDLDNDKINDIQVTFSNIYVNRAEITVKSLSNTSSVLIPPTKNTTTTEVTKITNDSMYNKLKGKIILKVEDSGKAYYISPIRKEMYYLGRPNDAFLVMRGQGIGITNNNLNKILVNKEKANSKIDTKFTKAHLGKIFIQTEAKGEAWYVNPSDFSRHYLGRPNDAFSIMRKLGLGISNADFDKLIK